MQQAEASLYFIYFQSNKQSAKQISAEWMLNENQFSKSLISKVGKD